MVSTGLLQIQLQMPQNISYTNIASIMLKEINAVRNNPQSFIPFLRERTLKYDQDGNYYPLAGLNFSVKTKEGIQGVQNLILFLESQRQCASLQWSFELHQAADKRCHFLSAGEQKSTLNRVANLRIGELVNEFTSWRGNLVQLTFYGFIEPRQFICELLLQDGRQSKQNRQQFFSRQLCHIGIGISTHEKYRFVIVLILAMHVQTHQPFMMYRKFSEEDISQQLVPQQIAPDQSLVTDPECGISDCLIF